MKPFTDEILPYFIGPASSSHTTPRPLHDKHILDGILPFIHSLKRGHNIFISVVSLEGCQMLDSFHMSSLLMWFLFVLPIAHFSIPISVLLRIVAHCLLHFPNFLILLVRILY